MYQRHLIISLLSLIRTQWPGFQGEWKVPMEGISKDPCFVSRAELANFVVVQFKAFASVRTPLYPQAVGTGSLGRIILDHR